MRNYALKTKRVVILILCIIALTQTRADVPNGKPNAPLTRPFDEYGLIKWEDEQARLDNFAIQLMNDPKSIGYMFFYDGNNMCLGEAEARATRAKRYVVEYRGVPWNRVIWRNDGYLDEFMMSLVPAPGSLTSNPFHAFGAAAKNTSRHVIGRCRARVAEIKKTKWKHS